MPDVIALLRHLGLAINVSKSCVLGSGLPLVLPGCLEPFPVCHQSVYLGLPLQLVEDDELMCDKLCNLPQQRSSPTGLSSPAVVPQEDTAFVSFILWSLPRSNGLCVWSLLSKGPSVVFVSTVLRCWLGCWVLAQTTLGLQLNACKSYGIVSSFGPGSTVRFGTPFWLERCGDGLGTSFACPRRP